MYGLNTSNRIYQRPEFQLPLVVLVAVGFIVATCFRFIPSTIVPFMGIGVRSELVAMFFALMFLLLSLHAYRHRETSQRLKGRIDAYCARVQRLLVSQTTLDEVRARFDDIAHVRTKKTAKRVSRDWQRFLRWYETYDSSATELWYYSTDDARDGGIPRECGVAIVDDGRVRDRWLLWSIDISIAPA